MNKNKQHGKYFENKIAEQFRTALNLSKHECYRSSFSGARSTVEFGDITFSDPVKYPFIIECKYYQSMKLDDFFPECKSYIKEWIKQLLQEKSRYIESFKKHPITLLVAGRPRLNDSYVLVEDYIDNQFLQHFNRYMITSIDNTTSIRIVGLNDLLNIIKCFVEIVNH